MRGAFNLRRLAVLALVVAMVVQPMAAPALASTPDDGGETIDCGEGEGLWTFFPGSTADATCAAAQQEYDQINNVNIYEGGLSAADIEETIITAQTNHIDNSDAFVWTIVKRETIEGLRNNLTKQEVKDNINESLDSYYGNVQQNLIAGYNSQMNHLAYLYNGTTSNKRWATLGPSPSPDNRDSVSTTNHYPNKVTSPSGDRFLNFSQGNVTNVNGTVLNYTAVAQWRPHSTDSKYISQLTPFEYHPAYIWDASVREDHNDTSIAVQHPDSSADVNNDASAFTVIAYESRWRTAWNNVEDSHDRMTDNAMGYVDDIYANYTASDFDGLELVDAITMATQFSTNYNSTGYYAWRSAEASTLGINSSVNSSFKITYYPDTNSSLNNSQFVAGETYNLSGALYTNWEPSKTNGKFVAGETYDTGNASVPVYFAYQNESGTNASADTVVLEGEFTVDNLTNAATGETINETGVENHNQQTANTTLTFDQMQQLIDYRDNITVTYDTGGGGGGGGGWFDGFDFGAAGFGFIAIAGGALVLLSNRS